MPASLPLIRNEVLASLRVLENSNDGVYVPVLVPIIRPFFGPVLGSKGYGRSIDGASSRASGGS